MKEPKIQNLFPTPIYMTHMDRPFTKQELKFVENQKNYCVKNTGNINTKDNYILNRKEFKNIKKFLDQCCKDYLKRIISPKNNIELYITQSWLNYTENDKIKFTNSKGYQQIKPEIDQYNIWNSETWWFALEIGQLVIFPSSTTHQVDTKKGNNTRISLAFNTFYKGTIGSNSNLTELIL